MYSLAGYGHMLDDGVRLRPYAQALRRTVRPGSVVLEIGTGPGVFAVLACQLGARRVYAIEPDPIIQVAREIAAANGCADRIEFIEDLSTRVSIPIQADVIVSDLRGVLPLFQNHLPSIIDARQRFLAPGGVLIPKRDALWAALVESSEEYGKVVNCWEKNPLDQDLGPARHLAVNEFKKSRFTPDQLLTPAQLWITLDYATVDTPNHHGPLNFSVQRPGLGHGIVVWFETCLADGIGFSNAPGLPEAVYGSMFLPWTQPVALAQDQSVRVDLHATLVDDNYVWRWTTEIASAGGAAPALRFQQSQMAGAVFSPEKLRRSASDYVPQLTEDGRLNRRALELMDGSSSLETIARQMASEFPQRFPRWHAALSYIAKLSVENT